MPSAYQLVPPAKAGAQACPWHEQGASDGNPGFPLARNTCAGMTEPSGAQLPRQLVHRLSAWLDPGRRCSRFHSRRRPAVSARTVLGRLDPGAVDLDVDLEQRGVAGPAETDMDHVAADLDIAADDVEQLFLQYRQKI